MKRRDFLKSLLGVSAVGALGFKAMAEPLSRLGVEHLGASQAYGNFCSMEMRPPAREPALPGDLEIAMIAVDGADEIAITSPGWALVPDGSRKVEGAHVITAYRMTGTQPQPFVAGWKGNHEYAGTLIVFRGVDPVRPFA